MSTLDNIWGQERKFGEERKGNLVEWIKDCAEGEEVEAVVIGKGPVEVDCTGEHLPKDTNIPNYATHPREQILTWEEAKKHLNYEFLAGYSGVGCEAIYAWTKTWVIFISKYEGCTEPERIPRNPTAIMPQMPGR